MKFGFERRNNVYGEGDPCARLMVVGEGPGYYLGEAYRGMYHVSIEVYAKTPALGGGCSSASCPPKAACPGPKNAPSQAPKPICILTSPSPIASG